MQSEYVNANTDSAGLWIVVHNQRQIPYPEDEGLPAFPGRATDIGMKRVQFTRLGKPHWTCREYNESEHDKYRQLTCTKECYQDLVVRECGCLDPYYPQQASHVSNKTLDVCSVTNEYHVSCQRRVLVKLSEKGQTSCDCPLPCLEETFEFTLSGASWPSDIQVNDTLPKLMRKLSVPSSDTTFFSKNILKVSIYYQELNLKVVTEREAYNLGGFWSDLGGMVGLCLGCSLVSIAEFGDLFFDLALLQHERKRGTPK